ncbi:non-ribosomal peptide synthetase, partial [Thermoflavimicrobium dichotomicum]
LQAYENSEYPFEELVEKLDVQRDLSRNPLFDTLFAWQNMESANLNIPGLILRPYEWTWKNAKFDLSWYGMERDTLHFTVEYSTALFKRETIERMTKHFAYILAQVAANPDLLLREIQLVTEEEKVQIFQVFNDTQANYPSEKTIHALFEEQVEKTPDQIAVVCAGESLTYRELNERANQVARVLRKQGAGPKSVVGLLTDRSVEMMIGILGILKSGAAYVPIDPDYPEERILYMLEDSGAKWLLVQKWEMLPASYGGKALLLKEVHGNDEEVSNLGEVSQSHDLAYVIYTSGSTGKPKGVMVEHRSVVRLLINDRNLYHFTDQDVWTQFHSYCFDVSVWEMLGALLYGGKLVIVPKHVARDPKQFRALLKKEKVTVLCQTPSAFTPLSDEEMEHEAKDLSVHSIIFVGEALYPMQLKPWKAKYPHTKFINMYGPTETSIYATYKELTPEDLELNISNIGRPLPTLQAYVLDVNQQLLPVGVIGELYISGDGVARGYLNRPELTAERFVENPFVPGERMYRTGDLARWLPNGEIEYLGRADEQVKIRGFRVELGEIKSKLLEHPQVKEAAVIARKEGHRHASLCAYLVIEGAWTVSEMRQHLAQFLPDHMLPSYFVQLEKLPLTPNGKLDRRALPAPEKVQTGTGYVAPTSKKEKILADIWQEVLKVDRVGIHDNFFELGGDSIKAIQIAARLHQEQLKLNMK